MEADVDAPLTKRDFDDAVTKIFGILEGLGSKTDKLGVRIDALDAKTDKLGVRMDKLGVRMDKLEVTVRNMGLEVTDVKQRVAHMQEWLEQHDARLREINA